MYALTTTKNNFAIHLHSQGPEGNVKTEGYTMVSTFLIDKTVLMFITYCLCLFIYFVLLMKSPNKTFCFWPLNNFFFKIEICVLEILCLSLRGNNSKKINI